MIERHSHYTILERIGAGTIHLAVDGRVDALRGHLRFEALLAGAAADG